MTVSYGDDDPRPGELCKCGRPAITVFITKEFGRVGYCGVPDGGATPNTKGVKLGELRKHLGPLK